jgi:phage FluMu gp28-like protein
MSVSRRRAISQEWEDMQKEIEQDRLKDQGLIQAEIIGFCRSWLGFEPTRYQERLLRDPARFIVARWARQTGKTTSISALSLHTALSRGSSRVVILAPSWRQSRRLLSKIERSIPKNRRGVLSGRLHKTRLEFTNGSSIEALPNSPETIRGETCDLIILDEAAFVRYDKELYDSTVYALTTTNGRFIAVSTPGPRDSLFYEMCKNDDLYGMFSRHHVSYRDAIDPNGPLKPEMVESLRVQMKSDPWRWQREMEAEFAEDADAFFPLSLLTKCVSYNLKTYDESIALTGLVPPPGDYYIGCDPGKIQDHSVVGVVEKKEGQINLIHMKQFALGTDYSHVVGYLVRLGQRLNTVRRTSIDQTGVGEYFVEDARKAGAKLAEGIVLTVPEKQNMLYYMRQLMEQDRLHFGYNPDLVNEMNVEQFEYMKTGQTQFSHPSGTHDDRLWAFTLAAYAARYEIPTYHPVGATSKRPGSLTPNLPRSLFRPRF